MNVNGSSGRTPARRASSSSAERPAAALAHLIEAIAPSARSASPAGGLASRCTVRRFGI